MMDKTCFKLALAVLPWLALLGLPAFADGGSAQANLFLVVPPSEANMVDATARLNHLINASAPSCNAQANYLADTDASQVLISSNQTFKVWMSP